jgi:ubiquinone/menaquinone biosynthesis C-methylase UbiE
MIALKVLISNMFRNFNNKIMILIIVGLTLAVLVAFLKSNSNKLLPAVINFFMKRAHKALRDKKQKLFEEATSQINAKQGERFKVLEIGVGGGENFKFYPKDAEVFILDKTDIFKSYYEESILNSGRFDLTISNLIVNRAENMHSIDSNSMNMVLHTFFLCSVADRNKVMNEIYRVLKPGGVCVFIEHGLELNNRRRNLVQKCVEPCLGDCGFYDMRKVLDCGIYDQVKFFDDHVINSAQLYFLSPIISGYAKKKM